MVVIDYPLYVVRTSKGILILDRWMGITLQIGCDHIQHWHQEAKGPVVVKTAQCSFWAPARQTRSRKNSVSVSIAAVHPALDLLPTCATFWHHHTVGIARAPYSNVRRFEQCHQRDACQSAQRCSDGTVATCTRPDDASISVLSMFLIKQPLSGGCKSSLPQQASSTVYPCESRCSLVSTASSQSPSTLTVS